MKQMLSNMQKWLLLSKYKITYSNRFLAADYFNNTAVSGLTSSYILGILFKLMWFALQIGQHWELVLPKRACDIIVPAVPLVFRDLRVTVS